MSGEEILKRIANLTLDEERALYALRDGLVEDCTFDGPADGESALKEARNITVRNCAFCLRYPFWHVEGFSVENCSLTEGVRAPLWYAKGGRFDRCSVMGVKALRECEAVAFSRCTVESEEFGWRCRDISLEDSSFVSQYFLFETKCGSMKNCTLKGKYSFQYTEDLSVENCDLDTKDAFWHSKNVTVKNSVVKGEYLGWYSEGLTLINCKIIGTQPLCYCKNLTLIDCTMEETDLSFEYSSVNATVLGEIESVKNPACGKIVADRIGQIILEDSVMATDCEIITKS
ncbi:MAG: DUF3737 family protein [Clostridia bacterium]|nr:DUF3737 family protein [Clostridia bacterium]